MQFSCPYDSSMAAESTFHEIASLCKSRWIQTLSEKVQITLEIISQSHFLSEGTAGSIGIFQYRCILYTCILSNDYKGAIRRQGSWGNYLCSIYVPFNGEPAVRSELSFPLSSKSCGTVHVSWMMFMVEIWQLIIVKNNSS